MQQNLLEKIRKLNRVIQSKNKEVLDFDKLCSVVGDVTDSSVFFIDKDGKIICKYIMPFVNVDIKISEDRKIDDCLQKFFWWFVDTRANMKFSDITKATEIESKIDGKQDLFCTSVPVIGGGKRFGTILAFKSFSAFTEEDIIVLEYASTVIGLELLNISNEENEEEKKKREMIKSAIETLSVSELEAVVHIFDELKGDEGLLVASRIADKVGITRSVIVNALRKFESAGLIETRSLGLKGTYIKILNEMVRDEIQKQKEKLKVK